MKGKDLAVKYKTILNSYGINTPIRLAYFFGQLHHESGNYKLQRESLNVPIMFIEDGYYVAYELLGAKMYEDYQQVLSECEVVEIDNENADDDVV